MVFKTGLVMLILLDSSVSLENVFFRADSRLRMYGPEGLNLAISDHERGVILYTHIEITKDTRRFLIRKRPLGNHDMKEDRREHDEIIFLFQDEK
jgi:hypothetical protein